MRLINCEINLILIWSKNCVLTDMITRAAGGINPPAINAPTNATFQITDTNLYVPVVTLSTEDDNKLLEQLKTRFIDLINSTFNKDSIDYLFCHLKMKKIVQLFQSIIQQKLR